MENDTTCRNILFPSVSVETHHIMTSKCLVIRLILNQRVTACGFHNCHLEYPRVFFHALWEKEELCQKSTNFTPTVSKNVLRMVKLTKLEKTWMWQQHRAGIISWLTGQTNQKSLNNSPSKRAKVSLFQLLSWEIWCFFECPYNTSSKQWMNITSSDPTREKVKSSMWEIRKESLTRSIISELNQLNPSPSSLS